MVQDVGQSILESYSRVMESLAFNILARIDDLLYVDDATKQRVHAAAESASLYDQGWLGCAPRQKGVSLSPSLIQQSPSTFPIRTRGLYSPDRVIGSPGGGLRRSPEKRNLRDSLDKAFEKLAF